jgi:hypothetical protein
LALQGLALDFPTGTLDELKPAALLKPLFALDPRLDPVDLSAPPFTFDADVSTGFSWTTTDTTAVSEGKMVAIFGHRDRASGWYDDMDYRCALIISRDGKNGWLIDRLANSAVRWEGSSLPEWCSE